MPSKKGSAKVSLDLSPEARYNLMLLREELRFKGIPATATGVVEVLVNEANVESLARAYRRFIAE